MHSEHQNLIGFLGVVEEEIDLSLREAAFDDDQSELLLKTVAFYRPRWAKAPFSNPLALFYLIARAGRGELGDQALKLAAFCQFYILSLDVFDDVQDDDVVGKPYADVGSAIAINTAIALMFLALDALRHAIAFEREPSRRLAYLELFNKVSLTVVAAQHRDLAGMGPSVSSERVIALHRAKTSSVSLVCQCAAIFAHEDESDWTRYSSIGSDIALIAQIVDDVRDIYGKKVSPDLASGKVSYPVACFQELADSSQRERFLSLKAQLPIALPHIQSLLYEAGVMRRVASVVEGLRRNIVRELVASGNHGPAHRTLAHVIDGLASGIYCPPLLAEAYPLDYPSGTWHCRVRALATEFSRRMAGFGMPEPPPLIPWHLPTWMYAPERGIIFYPDIEGQPEETLPFQAELLGSTDLSVARAAVEGTAPAVLAHELVHFWRHRTNNLGRDMWYEELVANTVAISYCNAYEPLALESALELARTVLHRPGVAMTPAADAILERLFSSGVTSPQPARYGVDAFNMALIHLKMVLRLSEAVLPLSIAIERYLTTHDEKAA